jgi:glucosamine-6-phosphate deaminase
MNIRVTQPGAEFVRVAADAICAAVQRTPDAALVVATGNTPMGVYRELATRRARGLFDPSSLRIFQLDEYLGVSDDDPRSLYGWMKRSFLDPLGIDASRVERLEADGAGAGEVCAAYDDAVAEAGGIDLSILGLGLNGHLGYNEPPVDPDAPTREVTLTAASVASGVAYWGSEEKVPRLALTAGMSVLLSARSTLLLVSGAHKRGILCRVLDEAETPEVPASFLRRARGVTILADADARPEGQ